MGDRRKTLCPWCGEGRQLPWPVATRRSPVEASTAGPEVAQMASPVVAVSVSKLITARLVVLTPTTQP